MVTETHANTPTMAMLDMIDAMTMMAMTPELIFWGTVVSITSVVLWLHVARSFLQALSMLSTHDLWVAGCSPMTK
jgi:hypothetical protein